MLGNQPHKHTWKLVWRTRKRVLTHLPVIDSVVIPWLVSAILALLARRWLALPFGNGRLPCLSGGSVIMLAFRHVKSDSVAMSVLCDLTLWCVRARACVTAREACPAYLLTSRTVNTLRKSIWRSGQQLSSLMASCGSFRVVAVSNVSSSWVHTSTPHSNRKKDRGSTLRPRGNGLSALDELCVSLMCTTGDT